MSSPEITYIRYIYGTKSGLSSPEITKRNLSKAGIAKEERDVLKGLKEPKEVTMSVWSKTPGNYSENEKKDS